MKSYHPCPATVRDRVDAMIAKFHPELKSARVKIDLVFVFDEDEDGDHPALTLHGYPCLAVVRKLGVKDRAMGRGDAEIVIDEHRYIELTAKQQDALLDHELYHLVVVLDGTKPKRDAAARPVLRIRKHDRQFGWFDAIASRHGENSIEIQQARQLISSAQQTYFSFMAESTDRAA